MTISEMVLETRKSSKLTQEQYGDKFDVTRQTVSSWENNRSYPDLQLLIQICDEYGISLDRLLREDKTMIKKVDCATSLMKLFIGFGKICGLILILFLLFTMVWYVTKIKCEKEFTATIKKCGFELQDGVYLLEKQDIYYTVPNQKLPLFKFFFFNDTVSVSYPLEDDLGLLISSPREIHVSANNDTDINFRIADNASVRSKEKLNNEEKYIYDKYRKEISTMTSSGLTLYNKIYNPNQN